MGLAQRPEGNFMWGLFKHRKDDFHTFSASMEMSNEGPSKMIYKSPYTSNLDSKSSDATVDSTELTAINCRSQQRLELISMCLILVSSLKIGS